jgi:hypothetical protein
MTIEERAKQFMPFSPLKGFDDAVLKKQFLKEPRKEITDDMAVKINNTLTSLLNGDIVTLVWYNNGCYQAGYSEYNQHYYDYQTNRGLDMGVICADDNHNSTENPYWDSFGGVTYILADRLEYGEIINAMENRSFYSSTGPRIFSLTADKGVLTVETSRAERILFVTNNHCRKAVRAKENESLMAAEFSVDERIKWVRVEVVDYEGKRAFTRAYRINEILE